MFLFGCTLLFDLFYMVRNRHQSKKQPQQVLQYRRRLISAIQRPEIHLAPQEMKHLEKLLGKTQGMLLFHEAVTGLLEDSSFESEMRSWLYANRKLFYLISGKYTDKRDPMRTTFFAYIIWQYNLCGEKRTDRFVMLAQELCMFPSLYCRENALNALYICGHEDFVMTVYLLFSRRGIVHCGKLVTDGLLHFTGDHNLLANAFWAEREQLTPHYQVCFINYIRMVSDNFCDRMLGLLTREDVDREVKFAAIRYLRSHPFAEAAPLLRSLVLNWAQGDWEFAAIAALSLEKYPGDDTEEALRAGCVSTNWYVRENSAESLLRIVDTGAARQTIETIDDGYARDMLSYKLNKNMDVVKI